MKSQSEHIRDICNHMIRKAFELRDVGLHDPALRIERMADELYQWQIAESVRDELRREEAKRQCATSNVYGRCWRPLGHPGEHSFG